MLKQKLGKYHIILASKSPRRQFLLKELGLNFEVRTKDTEESFPKTLKGKQIALYLCKKKALAFKNELKPNELLITADTIVWIGNKVLNKPENHKEAVKMLKLLSGKTHTVYTGVCITHPSPVLGKALGVRAFITSTKVLFKKLSDQEINFYVTNYKPYDKAGAYGAQECLPAGFNPCSKQEIQFLNKIKKAKLIKASVNSNSQVSIVKKISGSYFNVMGLPILELYEKLKEF